MNTSGPGPAVHPVEAPPMTEGDGDLPRGARMSDLQGMPGTRGGLILRLSQFVFALVSLYVMSSTSDFNQASAFR